MLRWWTNQKNCIIYVISGSKYMVSTFYFLRPTCDRYHSARSVPNFVCDIREVRQRLNRLLGHITQVDWISSGKICRSCGYVLPTTFRVFAISNIWCIGPCVIHPSSALEPSCTALYRREANWPISNVGNSCNLGDPIGSRYYLLSTSHWVFEFALERSRIRRECTP